jgi:capsular polysaccharide transport system permease protein
VRLAGLTRALAIARPLSLDQEHPVPRPAEAARPAPAESRRGLTGLARLALIPAATPAINQGRPSLRGLSFVVLVVLPVAVTALYYFLVAADQYVAEFRFTLNTVDPPRFDPLSLLVGNATHAPAALDSQILVQYITSRAIVDEIDGSLDLRRLFAPPEADWWARLALPTSIEELVHYWKGQVDPSYDPADGTVTVRVRGFAPTDTLRLAQAIVAACEKLVNNLSLRARRDMLRHAEADLAQTESRLKSVLGDIRAFRDREGLIDPARTAEAGGALQTRLRDELVRANAELSTLKTYMRGDAPSVRVLHPQGDGRPSVHSVERCRGQQNLVMRHHDFLASPGLVARCARPASGRASVGYLSLSRPRWRPLRRFRLRPASG